MKILHLNSYTSGGAAAAAQRLHSSLRAIRVESNFLSASDLKERLLFSKTWLSNPIKKFRYWRFNQLQNKQTSSRPSGASYFSQCESFFDLTLQPCYQQADIIHLHWVSHFLDIPTFFLKNKKPVVWTLHDTQPITGGCHANFDCEKWTNIENCHQCPQLHPDFSANIAAQQLKKKIETIQNFHKNGGKIFVVSPSRWLYEMAQQSLIFENCEHRQIYNGLNETDFEIVEQQIARKKLGLPLNKKILLFIAADLCDSRKGFQFLEQAMQNIGRPDLMIVTVGAGQSEWQGDSKIRHLGIFSDSNHLKLAYSAADYLVTPSLSDNLPNVIIESFFCGTPVIGFPVGGIVEMIENKINGYLCDNITAYSLAATIDRALEKDYLIASNNSLIRAAAVKKYNLRHQAEQYKAIYEKLCSQK